MDIAFLNKTKESVSNTILSKQQVIYLLKKAGVTYASRVFQHLKNNKAIIKVNGGFKFQKEPILKTMVEAGMQEASREQNKYSFNYNNKRKVISSQSVVKSVVKPEFNVADITVEQAIARLKREGGYHIYKETKV